jgi:O-antigen ligase
MPEQYVDRVGAWLTPRVVEHDIASLPASLRFALRASLTGVSASVVLFGYITETSMAFYAVMSLSLVVYLLARGEELAAALVDYLTSKHVFWRWAFVVWAILSLMWTTRGRLSVDRAITLVEIQIVGLIFYDAAKNLGLSKWILNTVLVSAVIAAVHAVVTEDPTVVTRHSGLYASPNVLGMFSVIGLAVFVASSPRRRGALAAIGLYVCGFLLLLGIVASSSLKGMMGLALVSVLGMVFAASRPRAVTFVSVAAGVGALLIAAFEPLRLIWNHALWRAEMALASGGTSVSESHSVIERARFIQKGLSLLGESPIIGRGLDTFRWLSSEGTYAHNNVVELGVALGIIGIVLFYGFHVSILVSAGRRWRTDDFVWRFIAIAVPTLLLLDIAVVSYASKLSTLLLIMCAGWLERTREDRAPVVLEGGAT